MDRDMLPDMPMGGASPGSGSRIVAGAGLAFIALAASQVSTGLLTVVVALAAARLLILLIGLFSLLRARAALIRHLRAAVRAEVP